MSDYSKYNVPEFHIPTRYMWWSWNPNYPKWNKSCWGGDTIEEAKHKFETPYCSSLKYYHNKLIKESIDGYEEVLDVPCEKTDIWDKYTLNKRKDNI